MENCRVLVLGGTGFVGRNLLDLLNNRGIDYLSISRAEGTDLCKLEEVIEIIDEHKPAFIVNCAAHVGSLNYVTQKAAAVVTDNMHMILNLYSAVAKVSPATLILNPVANCAYPASAETFVEENWWNGHLHRSVFSYGATRRMLWAVGECYKMQYDIRSIYLLVPNMYGPYDSTDPNKAHALNALVTKFVSAQVTGKQELEIWGTGSAIREWLFAPDFARIILEIITNPMLIGLEEPLNIGQNFGLSVRELVTLINSDVGLKAELKWDHSKPDGAPRKVMDDRRFRKVFPTFEFTDLRSGISETVKYYKSILSTA